MVNFLSGVRARVRIIWVVFPSIYLFELKERVFFCDRGRKMGQDVNLKVLLLPPFDFYKLLCLLAVKQNLLRDVLLVLFHRPTIVDANRSEDLDQLVTLGFRKRFNEPVNHRISDPLL